MPQKSILENPQEAKINPYSEQLIAANALLKILERLEPEEMYFFLNSFPKLIQNKIYRDLATLKRYAKINNNKNILKRINRLYDRIR